MGFSFRGTDLQTANIHFDLVRGFAEPPDVRGSDDIIPGAAGREQGAWQADTRRLVLEGWVKGTGATEAAKQQSWRSQTDALMALLDRTLAPGALVVSAPYLGLATGTKTIQAKCFDVMGGPIRSAMTFQEWSITLVALDPDWT